MSSKSQKEILEAYIKLAIKLGHHPSRADLISAGVSRDRVRTVFGNHELLRDEVDAIGKLEELPEKKEARAPKVLLFDIETAPILAHVWKLWENNVSLNQIESDWYVLAWAAKWLHEDTIIYKDQRHAKNKEDDKSLLKGIWKLLDQADVVVTQNGKAFDVKKLNARFIINGFAKPSSFRHIDTKQIAKKHFGFSSNSLEYLSNKLNLGIKKLQHKKFPGFELWKECLAGNIEAWEEMEAYNKADVLSLQELYKKISPWDSGVSFSVMLGFDVCKCGSTEFVRNGFHYTQSSKFQRYKCVQCGSETRGRKNLGRTGLKVGIS